jgi:DNA-binding cell septation regulator SpoVG
MDVKVKELRLAQDQRKGALAYVDIEFTDGQETLIVKGFTVNAGKEPGCPWVGFPQKQGKDGQWYATTIASRDLRVRAGKAAIEEYWKKRCSTTTS